MPETGQWNSFDKTRLDREPDDDNQDPGVNSDDENDQLKVKCLLSEELSDNIF